MLRPTRAADAQLDHIDRIVSILAGKPDCHRLSRFDTAYWRKRLLAIEEECQLVPAQRTRIARLLHRLQKEASVDHADGRAVA